MRSIITFEMGGKTWTVPSLNMREIKEISRLVKRMNEISGHGQPYTCEHVDILVNTVYTILSRNYPELKKEELEEMLNSGNINLIIEKVMAAAGFNRPLDN